MSLIGFLIDFEEGHVLPTIALAQSLKNYDIKVVFIGIHDCKEEITKHGFDLYEIGSKAYPAGFINQVKENQKKGISNPRFFCFEWISHDIKDFVEVYEPSALVVSTFLSLEAFLLKKRFGIEVFLFTPYLLADSTPLSECRTSIRGTLDLEREHVLFKEFQACGFEIDSIERLECMIGELDDFVELVACPVELDIPHDKLKKSRHYIGPMIRDLSKPSDVLKRISEDEQIIYVSMGSQGLRLLAKASLLYKKLIAIMADEDMKNYHLVVAVHDESILTTNGAQNITVFKWAPQIEILERASLVITHGGLGTVKEAIYYGVPMMIIPDKYDQPLNAERVVFHNLGLILDPNLTREEVKEMILRILTDNHIKEGIRAMKKVFRKKQECELGAKIIAEKLLTP